MPYEPSSGFYYFQAHAIEVVEAKCGLMEVCTHPRGGWTIGEGSEGTTIKTYHGNFDTAAAAKRALGERRGSMIRSYMRERTLAAAEKLRGGPEQQLGLF